MIDKKTLSTMADIMDGIVQSEEWAELQMNDPGIKAAESRLHRAMENARAHLPAEDYMELSDAQTGEVSAHCDVALLYGIWSGRQTRYGILRLHQQIGERRNHQDIQLRQL